jgi:hypothetical protein
MFVALSVRRCASVEFCTEYSGMRIHLKIDKISSGRILIFILFSLTSCIVANLYCRIPRYKEGNVEGLKFHVKEIVRRFNSLNVGKQIIEKL